MQKFGYVASAVLTHAGGGPGPAARSFRGPLIITSIQRSIDRVNHKLCMTITGKLHRVKYELSTGPVSRRIRDP